ncbi:MAG: Trm112 family protein [Anaerolineae bacterium]
MISKELLDILVCPYCKTKVQYVRNQWLVCQNQECNRKYPIKDDIPVMLIEEGSKWIKTNVEALPDPQGLQF